MERESDVLQGALGRVMEYSNGEKISKKIIAKFLDRITTIRNKNNKRDWGYDGEHDQEHHDDWT